MFPAVLQLDVGEKLRAPQLWGGADSMADVYDAARGRPVLHDTALQLAVAFDELPDGPQVTAAVGNALPATD